MPPEKETRNGSGTAVNKTMEISVAEASSTFPGFRFSPTDEELIQYYLKKKLQGCNEAVEVIAEVDICRFEPWDLPAQSVINSENEWFYFSPRGRKYPNGSQSKRATNSGYWKATGKERVIKSGPNVIGAKRTLVFHAGRAPRGQRTEWIMHEYTTSERSQDSMVVCRLRRNSEFHLHHSHENAKANTNSPSEGESAPASNGVVNNSPCEGESVPANNGVSNGALDKGPTVADSNNISKECSSNSNTSHSVEQDLIVEEEDLYADIMKDDIIKLDEAPPISIIQHGSEMIHKKKPESSLSSSSSSSKGTAERRVKLRRKSSYEKIWAREIDEGTVPCEDCLKKTGRTLLRRLGFVLVLLVLVFLYGVLLRDLSSRRILK